MEFHQKGNDIRGSDPNLVDKLARLEWLEQHHRHCKLPESALLRPPPALPKVSGNNPEAISLDVRRHLLHNHKLILAKTYWVFDTGEMGLAQEQPEIIEQAILSLPSIAQAHAKSSDTCQIEDSVERISSDATLNLFTWYRELEGGLWLEENQGKHAWVTYDSDEDESPTYSSQDSS